MDELKNVQDSFINHWGALGTAWGVNRTLTQIHALLMTAQEPMTTDQIMERLKISRGNAHSNIKELANWGIVKQVIIPGERKDYYTAEKDPWKALCLVARERKRREIEPALDALAECITASEGLKGKEAKAFHEQMQELNKFLEMADSILSRLGRSEKSRVLKWMLALI